MVYRLGSIKLELYEVKSKNHFGVRTDNFWQLEGMSHMEKVSTEKNAWCLHSSFRELSRRGAGYLSPFSGESNNVSDSLPLVLQIPASIA